MASRTEGPADELLVRGVLAGDREAERALIARHSDALRARAHRRILGRLRRRISDSDVMQETWMAVFERLAEFRDQGPGSFERWMQAILANKLMDGRKRHLRAAKRSILRETSADASRPDPAGDANRDPAAGRGLDHEDADILKAAIEGSSGDDRVILRLVHEQGLSLARAGDAMGRSAEASRKLYGRAVARLAARLRGAEAGRSPTDA